MKVVVGLGNPGPEYRLARHNVGFEVVGELSRRYAAGAPQRGFDGEFVEVFRGGEKLLLLTPLTYMNLSGRSVGAVVDFFKLPLEHLLIVCDDLDLAHGRLRLRSSGSAGGQNGLKDIFQRLGSESVSRLRVGIGRPHGRQSATDHVLGRFTASEREEMDHCILRAADAVDLWAERGVNAAMNVVNAAVT